MKHVPKPHPSFESYVVVVSESLGLCKVSGIGKTLESSSYGTQIHSEFDKLEDALASRYGAHKSYDLLQAGSLWTGPTYWMMGLYKKERTLATFWNRKEGSSLPGDMEAIMLDAKAMNTLEGYVTLRYEFTNSDTCNEEIKRNRDSGL
jgi:hypothetical protein